MSLHNHMFEGTALEFGAAMTPTPDVPILAPGALIDGRYRIVSWLATGGRGEIYQAQHEQLQRTVALKVMGAEGVNENAVARFLLEAQVAARIDHPNIATIYDVGVLPGSGRPYMVMTLLDGLDLEHQIKVHGGIGLERALWLFRGALDAIAKAHTLGIIHRDLKPANLFLCHPGTAHESMLVLDFGCARVDGMGLTSEGELLGTPRYLAPEYLQGHPASPRLDVYQMGLALVEAITGEFLVAFDSPYQCMMAHCSGDIPIPKLITSGPIAELIAKALALDPRQRFQDAEAFKKAIEECLSRGLGAVGPALGLRVSLPYERPVQKASDAVEPAAPPTPSPAVAGTPHPAWRGMGLGVRALLAVAVTLLVAGTVVADLGPLRGVAITEPAAAARDTTPQPPGEPWLASKPMVADVPSVPPAVPSVLSEPPARTADAQSTGGALRDAGALGLAGLPPALATAPGLPDAPPVTPPLVDPVLVLHITSAPEGADVRLRGTYRGRTPLRLELHLSELPARLVLQREGHQRTSLRVGAGVDHAHAILVPIVTHKSVDPFPVLP